MQSRIADAVKLRFSPVAVIFAEERPEVALQFTPGRWGCVISLLTAAAKGRVAVVDRETVGCTGGRIGLGFCGSHLDVPDGIPGGIEYFLSTGRGEGYPEGEGYRKTPEIARGFIESLPRTDIPYPYVIFKPLEQVDVAAETPQLIVCYANPDQLTALVTLANYRSAGTEAVIIPQASGCQSIGIIPFREAHAAQPRAVVGMLDSSARPFVDPDILSFTVPYAMFLQMEEDVHGSFLERSAWKKVVARIAS